MPSTVAAQLSNYLADWDRSTIAISGQAESIWSGTWSDVGAEMIRGDLAESGIEYTDNKGNDYDFHALRHQYITDLTRAGVSLTTAQQLARHSKPERPTPTPTSGWLILPATLRS